VFIVEDFENVAQSQCTCLCDWLKLAVLQKVVALECLVLVGNTFLIYLSEMWK